MRQFVKRQILACAITMTLTASVSAISMEVDQKIDTQMQKFLAEELSQKQVESYLAGIKKYNTSKHTVGSVLSGHKSQLNWQAYKDLELPKINPNHKGAVIRFDRYNALYFTADSLYERKVYFNDATIMLGEFDYETIKKIVSENKKVSYIESVIDAMIARANANDDKFEMLIFSTVIAIENDLDSAWCILDSCKQTRARRNLDTIMRRMDSMALDCEMGVRINLLSDLSAFSRRSDMQARLRTRLETEFFDFPEGSL